jgi:hypothetical protein
LSLAPTGRERRASQRSPSRPSHTSTSIRDVMPFVLCLTSYNNTFQGLNRMIIMSLW